jgi:tetratricopeptide (TPR) repeat protein
VKTKESRRTRHVVVVDESALAKRIGQRIRDARLRRGVSQRELASPRFTGQYVSSLERGAVKPSMAALNYLAGRLGVGVRELLDPSSDPWSRVEADLRLASGDVIGAEPQYRELAETAPTATARGEALLGRAEALCRQNRGVDAINVAAEALELFEGAGRAVEAAWAAYWLASAQYQTDNIAEARALLDGLLRRVRSGLEVEPGFKLRLLTSLASVVGWHGDHAAALSYLEEGRELIGELDPRVQAAYFFSLAQNYKRAGDLEAAVRCGNRSLSLYEGLDARLEISVLHNHLALTYLKLGNAKRAAKFADLAAAEAEVLGDERARAWVTETQAEVALAAGDPERALELCETTLALAEPHGSPETMLSGLLTRAKAHQALDNTSEARSAYERASEIAKSHNSAARRRQVLAAYADFLSEVGDENAALKMYREALS